MGRRKRSRAKLIALAAALALAAMVGHDLAVSPREAFGARLAVRAINGYRAHVSPRLGNSVHCRFTPTCSAYGRTAVQKYGLAVGGAKTIGRIARCGPWTKSGTVDHP